MREFILLLKRPPTKQQTKAIASTHRDLRIEPGASEVLVQRRTSTLTQAVTTAIRDLEAAGLTPVRVCTGDWVTKETIAQRISRSRELVRLWSIGEHGPGDFPPPINPGCATTFHSWSEVAAWLRRHMDVTLPAPPEPVLVVANLLLQARQFLPQIQDRAMLSDLLPLPAHPGHTQPR